MTDLNSAVQGATETAGRKKFMDLTGQKFTKLTVLALSGRNKHGQIM